MGSRPEKFRARKSSRHSGSHKRKRRVSHRGYEKSRNRKKNKSTLHSGSVKNSRKSHRRSSISDASQTSQTSPKLFDSEHELTYISLFSGIGGFELGIQQAFPNARCLGYSEIDPNALRVYAEHFPDHKALGDVSKLDATKFRGKVDLLVGGSPCQNFSGIQMNGDRKGLRGAKSSLLYEYIRVLDECRPKFFILENVNMKQSDRDAVSRLLGVQPVMIDSRVASYQKRKRLYWCNFDIRSVANSPTVEGTLSDVLLERKDPRVNEVTWKDMTKRPKTSRERRIKSILKGTPLPQSNWFKIVGYEDECIRTLARMDASYEWIKMGKQKIRNIHPIERERLQTFPDDWTSSISATRRYEVVGNAVTCDVIKLIVEQLINDK